MLGHQYLDLSSDVSEASGNDSPLVSLVTASEPVEGAEQFQPERLAFLLILLALLVGWKTRRPFNCQMP